MVKKFYLQYQWFPFYLTLLSVLYYIPYFLFILVNNDLITLRKTIKSQKVKIEEIVSSYFGTEQTNRNNLRIVLNVVVKLAYVFVNVFAFYATDSVLNGEFKQFGKKWIKWSELNNTAAHNYLSIRDHLKPGEVLLPTFGFCDVLELGKDIKHELINEYQLLCEISQHVLYHYVLIAIWFAIIFGIVVSVIGIIELFVRMFFRSYLFANEEVAAKQVFDHLPPRQREYLDFIQKKNVPIYGELIRELLKINLVAMMMLVFHQEKLRKQIKMLVIHQEKLRKQIKMLVIHQEKLKKQLISYSEVDKNLFNLSLVWWDIPGNCSNHGEILEYPRGIKTKLKHWNISRLLNYSLEK